MAKEPRDGGANVEAVFERGFSGDFPAPYLTIADLQRLADLCLASQRVICNIEAYEIDGELDQPRIDLGFYGEPPERDQLSSTERAAASHAEVQALARDARKERTQSCSSYGWIGPSTDPR